jgi:hypothetical protein
MKPCESETVQQNEELIESKLKVTAHFGYVSETWLFPSRELQAGSSKQPSHDISHGCQEIFTLGNLPSLKSAFRLKLKTPNAAKGYYKDPKSRIRSEKINSRPAPSRAPSAVYQDRLLDQDDQPLLQLAELQVCQLT